MIKKISSSIFNKKKSVNSNTKILYNYVLRLLTYGNPIKGLYSYKDALKYKIVDCGGFATLFLSLLQSIHIPSRLVVGFLTKNTRVSSLLNIVHPINFNSLFMHVWTEMLLPNNTWFPMDPAIEWRRRMGKSRREGGFGYIPNDRIVFSYGEDFAIRIHDTIYTVDLLQYPAYLK